jgi:hypothetical protein
MQEHSLLRKSGDLGNLLGNVTLRIQVITKYRRYTICEMLERR